MGKCKCGHYIGDHEDGDGCFVGWDGGRDGNPCPCQVFDESIDEATHGKKNDRGKPRMSLVHQDTLWGLIDVLEHGASKYGEFNFRKVENWRDRYYDAAQRHLAAWRKGEKMDGESGLHHLHHAIASLFFLSELDNEA